MNTETQPIAPPAPEAGVKSPAKPTGALVFACGGRIACPEDQLWIYPVGRRYETFFDRVPNMPRPLKDGQAVDCLACPVACGVSGRRVDAMFKANDTERKPGRMIRCKVRGHLSADLVAEQAGKEAA